MANIIKVPGINCSGKTKGCEKAPNLILENLKKIHSNEAGIPINTDLFDFDEIHLDNSNFELTNKLIYKNSYKIFEKKPKTIFLGGDHSVTYSLAKAFFDYTKENKSEACLIVFDAHPDCMKSIKDPTHEEWLRKLIEERIPSRNVLLVGVRNSEKQEIQFLKENGIQQISMNSIMEDIENIADTITEFCSGKQVYVSIDIDIIDPAFAPGTGYPESGGLSSREFIYLIQRINKMKNLRAVDLVEINPEKDRDNLTLGLGAKILGELV